MPEGWRYVVIVTLCKGIGKRTECKKYSGISLLSVVVKIYEGILIDRIHSVTEGLNDDEHSLQIREGVSRSNF